MGLITVQPTAPDLAVARVIARRTRPLPEEVSEGLTWGADEHVLIGLAAVWWLWAQTKPTLRGPTSDHVLLTTLAASALPHLLKLVFDQERPDRRMLRAHLRGVPFSGNKYDAFPSGHAIHVGALASVAAQLPPKPRGLAWGLGAVLVSTRVLLLAHWVSDVLAGLVLGAALERSMRRVSGFRRQSVDSRGKQF